MKFLSLALGALFAAPAVFAHVESRGMSPSPDFEFEKRHLAAIEAEREIVARSSCTMRQRAECYTRYRNMDLNTCQCTSVRFPDLFPRQPYAGLLGCYSLCKNPDKIAECWNNGDNVNSFCNCYRGNGPHPDPVAPGRCGDWFKIAHCHIRGMKTDKGCNCIPGTDTSVPGGGSECSDPNALGRCWSKGFGCNKKCVCLDAPPSIGKCTDCLQILSCAVRGYGVDANCRCNYCNCFQQWECRAKGGQLNSACQCIQPSSAWKRDDVPVSRRGDCGAGLTSCPLGRAGRFECLDTTRNIESCGGCTSVGNGEDCTAIEGADVACVNSKCVVSKCRRGFNFTEGACVPAQPLSFNIQ